MASQSPTARAKEYCKKQGWKYGNSSWWNHGAKVRQDLFGIIDAIVIAVPEMIGVQITSRTNHQARIKKILDSDILQDWLNTPTKLEVWSFDSKKLKSLEGLRFKRTRISFYPKNSEVSEIQTKDSEELI